MPKKPSRTIAGVTLVAFSLSTTRARAAYGVDPLSSSSGTSESSSGSTDGSAEGSTEGALTGTVASSLGTVAVAAIIVVVVVAARRSPADTPGGGDPDADTRLLLEVGLLSARRDLGTAVRLLVTSPAALDQVSLDVARGHGPALEALMRATGLSAPRVAEAWAAAAATGPTGDRASAERQVVAFIARLAPDLRAPDGAVGQLVLELLEERERPDFPADAPTHAWVARWLGVSPETVHAATGDALAELEGGTARAVRVATESDGRRLLGGIAAGVAARQPAEVQARLDTLVAQGRELVHGG